MPSSPTTSRCSVAAKNSGDKVSQLATPGIEGGSVGIGIAIRKDNPELKAAMQKALDDIMKDGTYEKISMKWIGRNIVDRVLIASGLGARRPEVSFYLASKSRSGAWISV